MSQLFEADRKFPAWLTLSWAWEQSLEDPAAVKAALARNHRSRREQRGLTQKALANAAGVNLAAIREIEAGRLLPEIVLLSRLAEVLGVSCVALIDANAVAAQATRPADRAGDLALPHGARGALV